MLVSGTLSRADKLRFGSLPREVSGLLIVPLIPPDEFSCSTDVHPSNLSVSRALSVGRKGASSFVNSMWAVCIARAFFCGVRQLGATLLLLPSRFISGRMLRSQSTKPNGFSGNLERDVVGALRSSTWLRKADERGSAAVAADRFSFFDMSWALGLDVEIMAEC